MTLDYEIQECENTICLIIKTTETKIRFAFDFVSTNFIRDFYYTIDRYKDRFRIDSYLHKILKDDNELIKLIEWLARLQSEKMPVYVINKLFDEVLKSKVKRINENWNPKKRPFTKEVFKYRRFRKDDLI